MLTAALFLKAKKWKQPKCLSADEWINKTCIYTMESYSAIKRNDVLIYATTCSMLENIT